MLVVETIAKIRRAYFQDKKSIKQICRELRVSRNTVRKVIRSGATELTYERTIQPLPKIGPWKDLLDEMLAVNARKPKRERLTRIRIFEELRLEDMMAVMMRSGALRNGAPFKDWDLPSAIRRVQRKLGKVPNGDRQMVQILSMIPIDGLAAVDAACAQALNEGVPAASVVINILARHREPPPPLTIDTPAALRLTCEPVADCKRYDSLRRPNHGKITGAGRDEPAETLRHEGRLR